METDCEMCLSRKAKEVGGWTAGCLLVVAAWTAGCLLVADASTASSRLSLGRCWVGAVMEQSRMYKTIIFLVTVAAIHGLPAETEDGGTLDLNLDATPASETKSEECYTNGQRGVCTPYFICKVESEIITLAPDAIATEEKGCEDYTDVCCPTPKEK